MRDQLGVGSYPVTDQPDGAGIILSLEAKDPEVRLTVCQLHCMASLFVAHVTLKAVSQKWPVTFARISFKINLDALEAFH